MALLASLVDRLRLELGDPLQGFQARAATDGATTRFNLPVELVDPANLKVVRESAPGTPLVEGTDFTMDYTHGVLTMATAPPANDALIVQGSHSETFLRTNLEAFVESAFLRHTAGRENEIGLPMTMSDLPAVEEHLLVILAQIDAIWSLITDAAMEIDVRSPDGITIPVGQRYQQLMGLLQLKKRQYEEMAAALNVGLHRIEMFNLRRTSRTTNRLVPVYKAMEYDQIPKGFTPDYGPPGTVVSIRGDKFTGVTEIQFGGVPAASFEVLGDGHLTAVVPEGAVTGPITIVTPGGTVVTHFHFTVGHGVPTVNFGMKAMRTYLPIDDGQI